MNTVELETVSVFGILTKVISASGEVQTNKEATILVKGIDFIRDSKVRRDHTCSFISWSFLQGSWNFTCSTLQES